MDASRTSQTLDGLRRRDGAFSLIELLVVIAVIGTLASMLLPAIKVVTAQAKEIRCRSSLRQVGLAMYGYTMDNDECLPAVKWDRPGLGLTNWTSLIAEYAEADKDANGNGELGWGEVQTSSVFKGCPLYKPVSWDPQLGYGMNTFLLDGSLAGYCNSPRADGSPFYGSTGVVPFRLNAITCRSNRLLVGEVSGEFRLTVSANISYRHQGWKSSSILFCDFRIGSLNLQGATRAIQSPQMLP